MAYQDPTTQGPSIKVEEGKIDGILFGDCDGEYPCVITFGYQTSSNEIFVGEYEYGGYQTPDYEVIKNSCEQVENEIRRHFEPKQVVFS